MVVNDGLFHGVRIRAVLASEVGKPIFVAFFAENAEWFNPDDKHAGADGWVRDFDDGSISGELQLHFSEVSAHENALTQLHHWQECPPADLLGLCSLLHQYVGFIDREGKTSVGIKLSAEQQDQP